ncbi:MAG: BACON domain-containing protein, partial [Prevotellaceae bacterium]|nr:BACON domain-containing protein [Prevotellaceae bacterium]
QLTQTVYADKTTGKSSVNITTTGAWTSSIAEAPATRAAAPTWISISPSSGNAAGAYAIAVTLEPNYSGDDRSAVITISCEGQQIVINLTQTSKKEDGTTLQKKYLPKRIYGTNEDGEWSGNFEYDEQDRLVRFSPVHKGFAIEVAYLTDSTFRASYRDLDDNAVYRTDNYLIAGDSVHVNEVEVEINWSWSYSYKIENGKMLYENAPYDSTSFRYDAAGNIAQVNHHIYEYDNKNGIFKNIKTPLWLLYDIQLDVDYIDPLYFFVNNITAHIVDEETFSYTYNNDNYPVTIQFGGDRRQATAAIEYY